jgi:hypothetical protein
VTRRAFLFLAFVWLGILPPVASAWAKDGDSNSGSGSDNSGSNSGSGSDNSGSGGGDDDDDDDDDDNSGSGSDNSGSGSGKKSEQDRALSAVSSGRAMPLEQALKKLRDKHSGRVIDVALRKEGERYVYRFKVKSDAGIVRKVVMDAATGEFRGFFGF